MIFRLSLALFLSHLALPAAAQGFDGQWVLRVDRWGTPEYSTLTLSADGRTLSGNWDGDRVTGTARAKRLTFTVTDRQNQHYAFEGILKDGALAGTATFPDHNAPERRIRFGFVARRVPDRPPGGRASMISPLPTFPTAFPRNARRC